MFTKIIALAGVIGACVLSAPIEKSVVVDYSDVDQAQHYLYNRNYQHSEDLNSYTRINYKYESNEVNSLDDLVIGNIYEFCKDDVDIALYEIGSNYSLEFIIVSGSLEFTNISAAWIDDGDYPLILTENYRVILTNLDDDDNPDAYSYIGLSDIGSNFLALYIDSSVINVDNLVIQLVDISDYQGGTNVSMYSNYFSYTDYNEILSVEYIQPTTILGYINEFCETTLFRDIPLVNTLSFNVGGENISLMTWLVIITGMLLSGGFIILLIMFVKWLVKIFSNGFLLR